MRIAHVCLDAGIPVFGRKGASVHVQGVVSAMRRAGHEVVLFAARLGDDRPSWADRVHVHCIPAPQASGRGAGAAWISALNTSVFAALQDHAPFDAVYERSSLWSFGGLEYARHAGIPGILEVNAPLIDEQAAHRGLTNRVGAERVACRAFQAASHVVAVSNEVADHVRCHPCRTGAVMVEPNGFDPDRFPAVTRTIAQPFTLGFLGTLKPWHGVDLLADILVHVRTRVRDARLLVVGDGPQREPLRNRLVRAGVGDAVEFAGAIAPEHVGPWLARMDVALAPYPADAPFYFSPLKVIEYMAAGVPLVASAIGQIPALVRHGVTGVLAAPGDARGFADACLALHADPGLGEALGRAARSYAMAERTWDAVVARILAEAFTTSRLPVTA